MSDLLTLAEHEGAQELRLEVGKPPLMVLRGQMRALDLPFLVQNLVELGQGRLLLQLFPFQQRAQGLHFFLKSSLEVAETFLGPYHNVYWCVRASNTFCSFHL